MIGRANAAVESRSYTESGVGVGGLVDAAATCLFDCDENTTFEHEVTIMACTRRRRACGKTAADGHEGASAIARKNKEDQHEPGF